jgi:hypothetical protein
MKRQALLGSALGAPMASGSAFSADMAVLIV